MGEGYMQDKSFLQAMQDLENRFSNNFQASINHMLLYGSTATNATVEIKDEKMRTVINNALISGQIIALLTLMRDLRILDDVQCDEFTAYLERSLASQHSEVMLWNDPKGS
jgi:predicted metalloenzyme YecM